VLSFTNLIVNSRTRISRGRLAMLGWCMASTILVTTPSMKNLVLKGLSLGSVCPIPTYNQIIFWHCRLGHLSFQYLKHLFPKLFKNMDVSLFQCESCYLSKSHRATYVTKPYCALKPFYLVHNDVWRPSKVTTLTGKKWFVTFIDDHTRSCWIYLISEKSEVTQLFKDFSNMIEN